MACEICHKKTQVGRQVSHSGIRTRRLFKPNIHTAWVVRGGRRVRMKLCTKCLRKVKREQKEPTLIKEIPAPQST